MKRTMVLSVFLLVSGLSMTACQKSKKPALRSHTSQKPVAATPNTSHKVVSVSEVKWEKLNPARGDKSPKAADLWGNRKKKGATGFLVQFVDGFSSPPHIHNVTYRAVVLSGLVHNDDPAAKAHWMPPGSFWTQPKGEAHITSARGTKNIAYVEIDRGPYLVMPTKKAFDSGQRPINMDRRNVVWLTPAGIKRSKNSAKVAYLWGDPEGDQPSGRFVRLPSGFAGAIQSTKGTLRAVLIQGTVAYQQGKKSKSLSAGSYFSSQGAAKHSLSCKPKARCLLYLRAIGQVKVIQSTK